MSVAPPLEAGAVQASATVLLPPVAVLSVGAPGVVAGVALRSFEGRLSPRPFVALTL